MVADYGSNSNMAYSILEPSLMKINKMQRPTLYLTVATVNSNFVAPNLVLLFHSENEWKELYSWGGHGADSTLIFGQEFKGVIHKKSVHWHDVSFPLDSLISTEEIRLGFKADFINGGWILLDNVSLEEKRVVSINAPSISFKTYPNPVTSTLYINFDNGRLESITVYNSIGEQVNARSFSGNQWRYDLDMSGHPTGIYYVSFQMSSGTVVTKKILKQ